MDDICYTPKHRAGYAGDAEMQRPASGRDSDLFDRLAAYSRRSKRGVVVRLDERRALRESLRPVRVDHFGGEAA